MNLPKNSQESASAPNLIELLRMQRQRRLQQESRSSAADSNGEESGYLLRLSTPTAAPGGSHRTSESKDTLRSILRRAVAILDESDDEPEDSVVSIRRDDSNSQPWDFSQTNMIPFNSGPILNTYLEACYVDRNRSFS
jgi:hypothetical protein